MTATWWRRNRLWLALLLPLLLLALSASAYRWANLYRPWHWSERVWPRAATGTLHQTYVGSDGQQYRRDVTVTVDGVTPVNVWEDGAAAPGARLWRVDLHLAAPPDQPLNGCEILLVDVAGHRYRAGGPGMVAADPDERFWSGTATTCVPEETPGPDWSAFTLSQPEVPRPAAWDYATAAVMPPDAEPVGVIVRWGMPTYLELEVPG